VLHPYLWLLVLAQGGVFTDNVIDSFIELKMEEVTALRASPHPVEFDMYYRIFYEL
jgi:glutamine synthetase